MNHDNQTARLRRLAQNIVDLDSGHPDFQERYAGLQRLLTETLANKTPTRGNPALALARQEVLARRMRQVRIDREKIMVEIAKIQARGIYTYQAIASALNQQNIKPPVSAKWTANSVRFQCRKATEDLKAA